MEKYFYVNYGYHEMPSGTPWRLQSFIYNRLHYITKGSGYFMNNNEKMPLTPGYVYLIPFQFEYHPCYSENTQFTHLYVDFLSTQIFNFTSPLIFRADEHRALYHALSALADYLYDDCPLHRGMNKSPEVSLLFNSVMEMINHYYKINYNNDDRISAVLQFIQQNYSSDITLDDMANLVHLEKNYFSKIFKNNIHFSPYQYLKQYRLAMGYSFLQNGHSVTEAARLSGYNSIYAFSNAIKKHTFYPPQFWINHSGSYT